MSGGLLAQAAVAKKNRAIDAAYNAGYDEAKRFFKGKNKEVTKESLVGFIGQTWENKKWTAISPKAKQDPKLFEAFMKGARAYLKESGAIGWTGSVLFRYAGEFMKLMEKYTGKPLGQTFEAAKKAMTDEKTVMAFLREMQEAKAYPSIKELAGGKMAKIGKWAIYALAFALIMSLGKACFAHAAEMPSELPPALPPGTVPVPRDEYDRLKKNEQELEALKKKRDEEQAKPKPKDPKALEEYQARIDLLNARIKKLEEEQKKLRKSQ